VLRKGGGRFACPPRIFDVMNSSLSAAICLRMTLRMTMLGCVVCCGAARLLGRESSDSKNLSGDPEWLQPGPTKPFRLFSGADEVAWVGNVEYYAPLPGFNRQNRDIDVSDIQFIRAWHFLQGWEFQLGVVALAASGTRTQHSFSPNPPPESSNAFAFGIVPLLRWNFLQFNNWRSLKLADSGGDVPSEEEAK